MKRVPAGERLDRIIAGALVVLAQVELWGTRTTPGPKALTIPAALLIPASMAVRRRAPVAAASVATIGFTVLLLVAAGQRNVPIGVALFSDWYALAVWSSTRGFVIGCGVFVVASAVAQLGPRGACTTGCSSPSCRSSRC